MPERKLNKISDKAVGLPNHLQCDTEPRETDTVVEEDDYEKVLPVINTLQIYMHDASIVKFERDVEQRKLLEAELFREITKGKIAAQFLKTSTQLNDTQQERLSACVTQADNARDTLLKSHARFVLSIAKRYMGLGVELEDLFQEGNLGLLRAIEKFDPKRNSVLSTYAHDWVKVFIQRALASQGRELPVYLNDRINKIITVTEKLRQELHSEPTSDQIAQATGLSVEQIEVAVFAGQDRVSLQKPLNDEVDGSELQDVIPVDDIQDETNESVDRQSLGKTLNQLINELSDEEARVLRLRYGLTEDRISHTQEDTARLIGCDRIKIQRIESKALRKLRQPIRSRQIRSYLPQID